MLHKATPIYAELPGWNTDLTEATERHHLPPAALDYVAFLETQVGVPPSASSASAPVASSGTSSPQRRRGFR